MDFCVNSLKFSFSDSFILLSSPTNLSTNLLGQPRNRSVRIQSSIFVVWELRDYNKILEKADMKRYWFWRLCVLYNWVKINTFSCRPFLRRRLLVATKITNIDDLILRLRLFTHPGKCLFRGQIGIKSLFAQLTWWTVSTSVPNDSVIASQCFISDNIECTKFIC